ncbi:hypothetical protein ANCDUO_06119 [Ancylostoma duodenale]|uniref:Uncharacterized protein n=1 Tax=Ancylostoma duodenale TaxID=51022 RepID=A0A0C2GQG9_9BILA|nr:hypothetical protein ANCDUO_06119 [Ancylostoma duodenale]
MCRLSKGENNYACQERERRNPQAFFRRLQSLSGYPRKGAARGRARFLGGDIEPEQPVIKSRKTKPREEKSWSKCHLNYCTESARQPFTMEVPYRGDCNVRRHRSVGQR